MEQNEVKNLAKSLITLYDMETSTATEKEIVEKIYDEDASLSDPLFKVVGHKAIMRRFLFIKGIFERSGIEVKSVGYEKDLNQVNIQLLLEYSRKLAWVLPVHARIHNFVTLTLNEDGKIIDQTDHFDVATIVKNIPLVSSMYDVGRYVAGSMVSMSVGVFQSIGGFAYQTPVKT